MKKVLRMKKKILTPLLSNSKAPNKRWFLSNLRWKESPLTIGLCSQSKYPRVRKKNATRSSVFGLVWLHYVEDVFDYKVVADDCKVKLIAMKLKKYALL